jgi:hypothetical protein
MQLHKKITDLYILDFYLLHLKFQFLLDGFSPAKEWDPLLQGTLHCKQEKAVMTVDVFRLIVLLTGNQLGYPLNSFCYNNVS